MFWKRKRPRRRRVGSNFEGLAIPKGATARRKAEAEAEAIEAARVRAVRDQVFDRERGECRCCREFYGRRRAAGSMHEIRPRSIGGEVSLENSIAVCGSGTSGCHGELQSYRIKVEKLTDAGAQGALRFYRDGSDPRDRRADSGTVAESKPRAPLERAA